MLDSLINSTSVTLFSYTQSVQTRSALHSGPVQRVTAVSSSLTEKGQISEDSVSLSLEGLNLSLQGNDGIVPDMESQESQENDEGQELMDSDEEDARKDSDVSPTGFQLTGEEEQVVRELQQRDRQVRAHEAAHLAVVGQYAAGGPSYTYQQGPDGRRYAVGGEVPIDVSIEESPEETIQKMQAIRRAAMAPAEPSATDRSAAASAMVKENRARQELQMEEVDSEGEEQNSAAGDAAMHSLSDMDEIGTQLPEFSLDIVV